MNGRLFYGFCALTLCACNNTANQSSGNSTTIGDYSPSITGPVNGAVQHIQIIQSVKGEVSIMEQAVVSYFWNVSEYYILNETTGSLGHDSFGLILESFQQKSVTNLLQRLPLNFQTNHYNLIASIKKAIKTRKNRGFQEANKVIQKDIGIYLHRMKDYANEHVQRIESIDHAVMTKLYGKDRSTWNKHVYMLEWLFIISD